MGYFTPRDTPATVRVAQKWIPGKYKRLFQGFTFPAIETVAASGGVPAHGIFHGTEADVVVGVGDYIVLRPFDGATSASSWYDFVGFYEEVLNAPA